MKTSQALVRKAFISKGEKSAKHEIRETCQKKLDLRGMRTHLH